MRKGEKGYFLGLSGINFGVKVSMLSVNMEFSLHELRVGYFYG